jgi:tetratricopeptide (TPR) repeat protein
VALAGGDHAHALELARRAVKLARSTGNRAVELASMLTEARALRAGGDRETAEARYAEAATIARDGTAPSRLREVLREWAGLRAEAGDHRGAYELTNEALAVN